jgi:hypothetical protein
MSRRAPHPEPRPHRVRRHDHQAVGLGQELEVCPGGRGAKLLPRDRLWKQG